jgi:hypothetical protein
VVSFSETFWNRLALSDRRLTGRDFRGNSGFLPGLDKITCRDGGTCDSRIRLLNEGITCTQGLLERRIWRSFGMRSAAQTFSSFNDVAGFGTSQGLTVLGDWCL